MRILEASENYLETVLMLGRDNEPVHAVGIATFLGYSKPTVSIAMKRLRENGYVTVNPLGHIELTANGLEIAERVFERHNVIAQILIKLGVNADVAFRDACKIEHDISEETFERMLEFNEKADR